MRLTRTNYIKAMMKQLGITQRELADLIGYSHSYVCEVLNGYRSETCLKIIQDKINELEAEDKKNAAIRRR